MKETDNQVLERIVGIIVDAGWVVGREPNKILHREFPDYRCRGDEWELFVNGNGYSVPIKSRDGAEIDLDPFYFAVFWNGWLAGLFSPNGGTFAASDGSNPETFRKSLERFAHPDDEPENSRSPIPGPEAA